MVDKRVMLVVDPDSARRAELTAMVRPRPHALVFAPNVDDGLVRLHEALPDVILLAESSNTPGATTVSRILPAARAAGAVLFVLRAGAQTSFSTSGSDAPDGVLPLPISRTALEGMLKEVATRRAASFAASAMELDLDAFAPGSAGPPVMDEPTSLSGPVDPKEFEASMAHEKTDVLDTVAAAAALSDHGPHPPEERTPSDGTPGSAVDQALTEPPPAENTNVGSEPAGLKEVLAASAAADEDVFATGGDAAPAQPARDPDTNASTTAPWEASRRPPIAVGERTPPAPGQPVARVVKLDSSPLPARVELAGAAGAPGARIIDEEQVGADLARALVKKWKELTTSTHHDVLGVARGASDETLAQALLNAARQFHPDRFVGVNSSVARDVARTIFLRTTEAFRTLRDPALRAAYEAHVDGKDGEVPLPPDEEESAFSSAADLAAETPPPPPPPVVSRSSSGSRPSAPAEPARPSVMVDLDNGAKKEPSAEESPFGGVRPALVGNSTAAARPTVAPPPKAVANRPRTTSVGTLAASTATLNAAPTEVNPVAGAPTPPAAPGGSEIVISEELATTAGAKKFLKLAAQALGRNDLNAARLNMTFALGYEPDNQNIKKRLADLEVRIRR